MEELLANTLHEFAKEEKTSKEFRAHMEFLLKIHRLIAPSSKEWVEETKVECLTSAEEREKKKRAEAAKERDKEYRECIADQLERKQLGERIRELIHIQNKERRQLHEEKQKH